MIINKKEILNYIIMFALMIGIGLLPPISIITPLGMKVLGVFIGVIYGWIMIDSITVSMIGFIALALTGYKPLMQIFISAFTNTTVITVFISVIFAGAIAKTNCIDIIAKYLLTSNMAKKEPWGLVLIIFLLAALGHVCQMMLVTVFLLWSLTLKLADQCGYERNSMFITYMITMISVIAVSTGLMFPWKPVVLAFTNFWEQGMYQVFPYAKHMLIVFIYLILFIFSIIFMGKYILKMDISKFKLNEKIIKEYETMKIEPIQKFGLISILLFAVIMFIGSLLPPGSFMYVWFNKFGLIGITIIFLFFLSLLRNEKNEKLIDIEDSHKSIPWSVIWLLLFIIPLCEAMQSAGCGIIPALGQILIPIFGEMNITIFMIIALILIGTLTQIFNNIALAAVFLPVFYAICSTLNGNTYVFFIMLLLVLNCDATTPAGSTSGAMVHGHSEVNKKYVYLFGLLASLITLILSILIVFPLGNLII